MRKVFGAIWRNGSVKKFAALIPPLVAPPYRWRERSCAAAQDVRSG
jgi:hypothetical protein